MMGTMHVPLVSFASEPTALSDKTSFPYFTRTCAPAKIAVKVDATLNDAANKQNFNPDYTSVSFVSSHDLYQRIKKPANIMVTEVVPDPNNCKNPWCKQFIEDIEPYHTSANRIIFEGYLNAVALVSAAQKCPTPLNNQCLLTELTHLFTDTSEFADLFNSHSAGNNKKIYRSYFKK